MSTPTPTPTTRPTPVVWSIAALSALAHLDAALCCDPVEDVEHAAAQVVWAFSRLTRRELGTALFASRVARIQALRTLYVGLRPPRAEIRASDSWTPQDTFEISYVLFAHAARQVRAAEHPRERNSDERH